MVFLLMRTAGGKRVYAAGGAREASGSAMDVDDSTTGGATTSVTTTAGAAMAGATVGSCVTPAAQTAQALLLAALRASPFSHSGCECTSGSIARSNATATIKNGSRRSIFSGKA